MPTARWRVRTAAGDWDSEALLEAFSRPEELRAAGGNLGDVAMVLRELVVSRQAMRQFASEMGWSESLPRSFLGVDPKILDNAERWLGQVQDILPHDGRTSRGVVDARLAAAFEVANAGAPLAAVETALPIEMPGCRARVAFIRGEAEWRNRMAEHAAQDFRQLVVLAPQLAIGHRRLGQIAYSRRDFGRAARHFEGAIVVPNQRWMNADQPDDLPILLFRFGSKFHVYRYRGGLYSVPVTPNFIGVAAIAGRMIQVFDTPAYRILRRIRPRRSTADRLRSTKLWRQLTRLAASVVSIPAYAIVYTANRYPGFGSALKRLARLLLGNDKKVQPSSVAPGRLLSILLRVARPFRRTWIGRVFRRVQGKITAKKIEDKIGAGFNRVKLAILFTVFQMKELPAARRANTMEELIDHIGRPAAPH